MLFILQTILNRKFRAEEKFQIWNRRLNLRIRTDRLYYLKSVFRNLFLIILLFNLFDCKNSRERELESVLNQIFPEEETGKARPEFLLEKDINLDSDPDLEKLYVVRNIKEEILAIFKKENGNLRLSFKTRFSMPHYGPFKYSMKKKSWEPYELQNHGNTYIINNMQFFRLPGDSFYSIFMEILSEEPPVPLFSVPFIYREGKRIFDGIETLKEKKFLSENLKTDFMFDENSGRLNIMSPRGMVEMSLMFSGAGFREISK